MREVAGLNVLIVCHHYPPHLGGLEVVAQQQARRLAARGAIVTVLTAAVDRPGVRVEDGVVVHRMRSWCGLERFAVPFPLFTPSIAWTMLRAVRRADLVHIHDVLYISSWLAGLFALLMRKPVVLTQHVGLVDHPSRIVRAVQVVVRRTLGRLVLAPAVEILPITTFIEADSRRIAPSAARVSVLPNGVDVARFRPALDRAERAAIREEFGLPLDEKLVLFIGRFVPKKGFGDLAACVSERYRMVFVGGERPSDVTDPRHLFLGRLDEDQAARVYRAVDLYVSASVGECPLTVLEALASGAPALLNDDPGHRALPLPDDGVRWADLRGAPIEPVIAALVEDDRELARLARAGRGTAERSFSWERNVDRLTEVYRRAVPQPEERTRVAVVTPRFAPHIGGVESYTQQVVDALHADDAFDVVVITTADGWRSSVDEVGGVRVHRLGTWLTVSNSPVSPLWPFQLRGLVRRYRVDVVHAHAPVPGLADATLLALRRVPVVFTYHSGSLVKGGGAVDVLIRLYEKWVLPRLFSRAESVLAVSPAAAAMVPERRIQLVPPGVDTKRFDYAPERPGLRVLYVGRIERTSRWKGIDVLLEAFRAVLTECPAAQLHLVGGGDDLERLRKVAAELGIGHAVTWRGELGGRDLVDAYHDASVVVLPSLTEAESFGMTLVEAMACGRAVVASDVGGIGFVVRDGVDGLLVAAGEKRALGNALLSLLRDPARRAAMGRAGHAAAISRWTWSTTLDHTLRALRGAGRMTEGVRGECSTSARS